MRCIETQQALDCKAETRKINRNMRCIETMTLEQFGKKVGVINRNMRCIETPERNRHNQRTH